MASTTNLTTILTTTTNSDNKAMPTQGLRKEALSLCHHTIVRHNCLCVRLCMTPKPAHHGSYRRRCCCQKVTNKVTSRRCEGRHKKNEVGNSACECIVATVVYVDDYDDVAIADQ